MTVSTNTSSSEFSCNGATTNFVCDFRVLDQADMRVFLVLAATGEVVQQLTLGTDFLVLNVGAAQATVQTTTIYSSLYKLRCRRKTTRLQETDWRDNDPFPAETTERAVDRLTMMAQEDEAAFGRALIAPDGETLAPLPEKSLRALRVLAFDADGNTQMIVGVDAGSAAALALDLANGLVSAKGAGLSAYNRAMSYVHGTVGGKLKERISVFDFMTAAQRADVQAGTRLINVTAAVQAAVDFAKAIIDRETEVEFMAGDYAVNKIVMTGCRQVTIICRGAVFLTGVSASDNRIVEIDSTEPSPTTGLRILGRLSIQAAGSTNYQVGLYARFLTDSMLDISVSGAFSTASVDLDACFNNKQSYLYATNSTANKPCILFGQNNCNVNDFFVRVAGIGPTSGQIGVVLSGSNNRIFGDCSNVQYGLKLFAARGSTVSVYTENCGNSIICEGLNRGNSIVGGTFEVLSSTTGWDFSGGSLQGLAVVGARFKGLVGGTARQAINWGGAAYGVNLLSYDVEDIDTVFSGTLRGSSGGLVDQLIGAVRHRSNGVASWMAGWTDTLQTQAIAGAGTINVDASLGNEVVLTISTTGAQTIAAPTNPTAGQHLTYVVRNNAGGALGAFTWNAVFKMAAWTNPASATSRSITFRYDGTNWVERSRTPADVPN